MAVTGRLTAAEVRAVTATTRPSSWRTAPHDVPGTAWVFGAQVVLVVQSVLVTILLTARLHDAVPSAIRSSLASGVGTATWLAFLSFGLVSGQVSQRVGVDSAAWRILAPTALCTTLLVRRFRTSLPTLATDPADALAALPCADPVPAVVPAAAPAA